MSQYTMSGDSSNSSKISEESGLLSPHLFKNVKKLHEEFSLIETLGKGGFGRIFKAKRRFDDKEFAIKIIKFECNVEDAGKYKREAKMLSSLDHNNIVRYYNSWIETAQIPLSEYEAFKSDSENSLSSEIHKLSENGYIKNEEEDEIIQDNGSNTDDDIIFESSSETERFVELKYLFIQMELCDKRTLRTAIDDNLYQKEEKITKYFKEICEGLLHIHGIHIVHRDLKPQNIFLTSRDVIKIGDFGLSKQIALPIEQENSPSKEPFGSLSDVCGTVMYIAPEIYTKKLFNKKADIYSLGIIYFEMCSEPMTEMEKSKIFPLSSQKLKTIHFRKNTSRKRLLLRSMTRSNCNKRPTCEDILKILNVEKSINEVKEIIHRNKKVPPEQINTFGKLLRSKSNRKINCSDFFLKTAIKIFELHCAQNIPIPTFLPSFSNHNDNLTTLLNINGNSVSIANTSRIGFAYFVAQNKSWNLRRYSIGTIFEEGYFLPTETQECIFEAVSSQSNDLVNDAEVLRIAKEVCDYLFRNDQKEICFFINHRQIFSIILNHCRIIDDNATLFTNIMIDLSKKVTEEDISSTLYGFDLPYKTQDFLIKLCRPLDMATAQQELTEKFNSRYYNHLTAAVQELHLMVLNANRFGIKTENIFLSPLLMVDRIYSGFTFKIELERKAVIATGGRFESLIKECMKQKKEIAELSAVGISFAVDTIIMLLRTCLGNPYTQVTKVFVYTKEKSTAIPLLKRLLEQQISCEIVTTLPVHSVRMLIVLRDENHATLYVGNKSSAYLGNWNMALVYDGLWKKSEFCNLIWNEIYGNRSYGLSPTNSMIAM